MEIIQRAWTDWIELKEEQVKGQKEKSRRILVKKKKGWQPSDLGCVKLNISSAGDGRGNQMGLGIIARDNSGQTVQEWSVVREKHKI